MIKPRKLRNNSKIKVVAFSNTLDDTAINHENFQKAVANFENNKLQVLYNESLIFQKNGQPRSIEERCADFNSAVQDPDIDAIISLTGGYYSNQLLRHLDYKLITENPKIISGFSNNTFILNSILSRSKLITFHSPNFIDFFNSIEKVLHYKLTLENKEFDLNNESFPRVLVINQGNSTGLGFGGNLNVVNLMQGSIYFPSQIQILFAEDIENLHAKINEADAKMLFLEDTNGTRLGLFIDGLYSLINSTYFNNIKGIIIGCSPSIFFSILYNGQFVQALQAIPELREIPIIANLNFGHCNNILTLPFGAPTTLEITGKKWKLKFHDYLQLI